MLAQNLPELPRAYVDATLPVINGNTYTVNAGGNLQAAIDQAAAANSNLNHLIVVQAGATFDGSFILRSRGAGTGWIMLQSSAIGSLPPAGTRVNASHASLMPTLRTNTVQEPAVKTEAGAHHYRIIGLRFTMSTGASPVQTALVRFGSGGESDATIPHHLIFDRSWADIPSTVDARNAVYLNAAHAAVIDSRLSGAQEQGNESHAIVVWNSPGPLLVENSYLEGASINLLMGGAGPVVSGTGNPQDVAIRRNFFTKQLRWKKNDPAWDGKSWAVKNAMEFKAGTRVLVENNILERSWGDAQEGWLVRFVLGSDVRADIADITLRNNILRHGGYGLDICGNCSTAQFVIRRVLIENTLIHGIDPAAWSAPGGGWGFMFRSGAQDITLSHVTIDNPDTLIMLTGAAGARLNVHNTIGNWGDLGVWAESIAREGAAALDRQMPGWTWRRTAVVGALSSSQSQYPSPGAETFFAPALFTNPTQDDYHLAAASPYKGLATDGKDLGADIDALNAATSGCITGVWGPPPPAATTPPAKPKGVRLP